MALNYEYIKYFFKKKLTGCDMKVHAQYNVEHW